MTRVGILGAGAAGAAVAYAVSATDAGAELFEARSGVGRTEVLDTGRRV